MVRWINVSDLQQVTAVQLLSDPGQIPGSVVIPSCAQIVLQWTLEDGHLAHNVTYGRYSGAFSGTVAQANALLSALTTGSTWNAMATGLATTTTLSAVTIRDVNSPFQPLISSTGTGAPGTATGESLPNEVAIVSTLRTAQAGRSSRGRLYLPGWAVSVTAAGNVIASGFVNAVTNWTDGFRSIYPAQGYTWVLGQRERQAYTSPITGRQFPHRPAGSIPIIQALCKDNHWDTQRRRGLK